MNILIIGAGGFIGRNLVTRLLSENVMSNERDDSQHLILLDHSFPPELTQENPNTTLITGTIADMNVLQQAFKNEVDYVFHLASVPGGLAEKDFALGMENNLQATINILECLRAQTHRARVVFASSIAVYGVPMPDVINEQTLPLPSLSYGMQKLVGEQLVAEYSRRNFIDGISLRLPGIVARPAEPSGLMSAFLSNLFHDLASGKTFECPVSGAGKSWWMSINCIVDNFIHAACLPKEALKQQSVWLIPVLYSSIEAVVAAVARAFGHDVLNRVNYHNDEKLQNQFANYPPLECPESLAIGFKNDGDTDNLVKQALSIYQY